jgi:hypothetical protein
MTIGDYKRRATVTCIFAVLCALGFTSTQLTVRHGVEAAFFIWLAFACVSGWFIAGDSHLTLKESTFLAAIPAAAVSLALLAQFYIRVALIHLATRDLEGGFIAISGLRVDLYDMDWPKHASLVGFCFLIFALSVLLVSMVCYCSPFMIQGIQQLTGIKTQRLKAITKWIRTFCVLLLTVIAVVKLVFDGPVQQDQDVKRRADEARKFGRELRSQDPDG